MAALEIVDTTFYLDNNLRFLSRGEDLVDYSNHGGTLTNNNGATFVAAKFGNGFSLASASNQTLTAADNDFLDMGTGAFTISCWVKRATTGAFMGIVAKIDNSDAAGYRLAFLNNDKIEFNCSAASAYNTATTINTYTSTAAFYHIVGVRGDGANLKIYVDATQDDDAPANGNKNVNNAQVLAIGAYRSGSLSSNLLNGVIDDIAIFNKALTSTEVTALYNGTSPLVVSTNYLKNGRGRNRAQTTGVSAG